MIDMSYHHDHSAHDKYLVSSVWAEMGTVLLDWNVTEPTTLVLSNSKMMIAASCCQLTSNEPIKWYANPSEDHTAKFGRQHPISVSTGDKVDLDEGRGGGDDDERTECLSCQDKCVGPNFWGLILSPCENSDEYVRVGVFVLLGSSHVLDLVQRMDTEVLRII